MAVATVAIAGQALADTTPVRYLMTVDSINTNPFQVLSFSWGISNPATTFGGGIHAGVPSLSSFNIMKSFDANDPAMINACFHGDVLANARVRGFRGSSTVPFLDIFMENVMVESAQMSGSQNSIPVSSVSFAFEKITINGVVLDPSTLVSNPQRLNDIVASITRNALANSATPLKAKKKVTIH